eukprot:12815361-Ditylum_brightwellii.AAC.1
MVLSNTSSCDSLPQRLRLGNARSPSNSPSQQTQSHTPSGRTTRSWNCGGGNGGGGNTSSGGGLSHGRDRGGGVARGG